jgi:hypothetical protein
MSLALAYLKLTRGWFSRSVPGRWIALAVLTSNLFLFLANAFTADISTIPAGVFSLTPFGKPIAAAILINPLIAGVSINWNWPAVEQSVGMYNWSYFDTQIARAAHAGKKSLLRISAGGQNSPQWVFDAGVQTFSFINTISYQPTYGQTVTIPVFWDPIFLANATTDDWQMPSTKTDVQNWRAIGYTSDKLINACKETIDATMAAFPNKVIALPVGRNGNMLDPDPDYVARAVVEYANRTYPGRFITQKHSLSADVPDPEIFPTLGAWQIIYDNHPAVAGQMLWFVTNDPTCRMNGKVKPCDPATVLLDAVVIGARYDMRYQEIYQPDILNPALADVINVAAGMLTP